MCTPCGVSAWTNKGDASKRLGDWREGVKDNRIHPVVKKSESVRSLSESAVNSFDMSINLNHMIYSAKLPLKIK